MRTFLLARQSWRYPIDYKRKSELIRPATIFLQALFRGFLGVMRLIDMSGDNWLENLLISASMRGYRNVPPNPL